MLNVATPATAATVTVPVSVAAPGFAPMAIVTLPVKPVAVLPSTSRAVTWMAGAIDTPAAAPAGGTVNTSALAVPPVTLNVVLVAPVSAPEFAVSV